MFMPTKKWKKQRDRWHMRLLRKMYVRRRFCSLCESYRDDEPEAREVKQYSHNSATAVVYKIKRFRRERFLVKLGAWQEMSKGLVLSRLVSEDDLVDAIRALNDAQKYILTQSDTRR